MALSLAAPLPGRLVSTATAQIPAPAAESQVVLDHVPGVVLVGLMPGVSLVSLGANASAVLASSDASLSAQLEALGVVSAEPVFDNPSAPALTGASTRLDERSSAGQATALRDIYRLRLQPNADLAATIEALQANPAVVYAEPDYLARQLLTPNDTHYADQWGLAKINASAAWDTVTGAASVAVAVIDSGLDTTHPDLAGKLWVNPGEIPGNGIDDDNNGFVDDIYGWNILNNNANLFDLTGHGTQVAGVIAAATNNSLGIAGVCWHCRLMVVKVSQVSGVANYSDIAAGVAYAAGKGARVINISLGGASDSITLKTAIAAASATAVIVAGAGNDNSSAAVYPAAYDDYVLAVAGTTVGDVKVSTSNFGSWVDVSAPGEAITTTLSGGGYGAVSGTSVAGPFAAGLAGLVRSQQPSWSANQVRAQIINTTDNINAQNPGHVGQLGSGRINAHSAVTTVAVPKVSVAGYTVNGVPGGALKAGSVNTVTVTLRNDWASAASVTGTLSESSPSVSLTKAAAAWGAIATGQSAANDGDPLLVSVNAGAYGLVVPFTLNTSAGGTPQSLPFSMATESQVQTVSGAIISNTIWTSDRIYHATGSVTVNAGVTLTIQPGTVVKFNSGRFLVVNGTLVARGTENAPITFTSALDSPAPGDWGGLHGTYISGIHFRFSSATAVLDANGNYVSGTVLAHSIIEYGQGIVLHGASPLIERNLIRHNTGDSTLHIVSIPADGKPVVRHNQVIDNEAYLTLVVDITPAFPIEGNLVGGNKGGLLIVHSAAQVISNTITGNASQITVPDGDGSTATIELMYLPGEFTFAGNNIVANASNYALYTHNLNYAISATNNHWGTNSVAEVANRIFELVEPGYEFTAPFQPILTQPNPDAPAFLVSATLNPASPVGIQQAAFDFTFSRAMDEASNPIASFRATAIGDDEEDDTPTFTLTDNAQWLNDRTWRATFDFTSLVARGMYGLTVSGATGLDGIEIAPDNRFTFTVDYAGSITTQTPPGTPVVYASGIVGNNGAAAANWAPHTGEAPVVAYRYAIGSTPGGADIINWTKTTATFMNRNSLGLWGGQAYWVSVQAQNNGGLWSPVASSAFVSGAKTPILFLPVVWR